MTAVRRGTARRLGLRTPYARRFFRFRHGDLTEQEIAQLQQDFLLAQHSGRSEFVFCCSPEANQRFVEKFPGLGLARRSMIGGVG